MCSTTDGCHNNQTCYVIPLDQAEEQELYIAKGPRNDVIIIRAT